MRTEVSHLPLFMNAFFPENFVSSFSTGLASCKKKLMLWLTALEKVLVLLSVIVMLG